MTTPPGDPVAQLRDHYQRTLGRGRDGATAAVTVLLSSPDLPAPERFGRHVDPTGIDWEAVLAEDWSSTQRFLLATAACLWWSRRVDVDLSRLAYLDDDQYRLWLGMIEASRTGRLPT